jgi:hypothetical protein
LNTNIIPPVLELNQFFSAVSSGYGMVADRALRNTAKPEELTLKGAQSFSSTG